MHTLLITDSYPPEIRSASGLMHDLAAGLRDRGHRVSVLTCYPQYNLTAEAKERFADRAANRDACEDGIRVIRVEAEGVHNCGPFRRGLAHLRLPPAFARAAGRLRDVDAVLHYSPPLTLGLAAVWLKRRCGAAYVMNVQDLFPQNAIDLGVLRNPAAIALFRFIERCCYRNADHITCHSSGNRDVLMRTVRADTPISVVPNWVDLTAYDEAPASPLLAAIGLRGKFVLMFGGVMGYAQDLDTVIECARLLADYREIAFLLVGDGVEKERLVGRAGGLANLRFHPFVAPDEYTSLVRTVDVGLVTLCGAMQTPVVPSKILGFMAARKPWIGCLPVEGDAWRLGRRSRSALLCRSGDAVDMAKAVLRLFRDRERARRVGQRGREYCERHFARTVCVDRYHAILCELREGRAAAGSAVRRPAVALLAARPQRRAPVRGTATQEVAPHAWT